ncbi:MAG: precorrin-3B C(17)-methyltransferase [Syntrophobacteraceae bacterium]
MQSSNGTKRCEPPIHGDRAEGPRQGNDDGNGHLSVVSLGPGGRDYLAPAALSALERAEVIVGYKTYLDLIRDLTRGKEVLSSGMRKEIERCNAAIDRALEGKRVALVSSGDAGIYGMAGLALDLCRERGLKAWTGKGGPPTGRDGLAVEIIPGVPAFNAAASRVGAPLMHDFAAVSLSDHLTPWETIERRLVAVAEADFVVAIYNPRSKSRPDFLEQAQRILLRHRSPETPVAIVHAAMREDEWTRLVTLAAIPFEDVDMQSVLIVGNSCTYAWDGWMVTPRGYLEKYGAPAAAKTPRHQAPAES